MLYLFGTPGQDRFWFMWDELARARSAPWSSPTPAGWRTASPPSTTSSGAGLPFVVAVNCFDGARGTSRRTSGRADLGPEVPVVLCDARERESVKEVLVSLVRYVMARDSPMVHGSAY